MKRKPEPDPYALARAVVKAQEKTYFPLVPPPRDPDLLEDETPCNEEGTSRPLLMNIERDEAMEQPQGEDGQLRDRVLDLLCRRYRDSIDLVPVRELDGPVYGFDPKGWALFAVIERFPTRCGGVEHVAVHRVSGEMQLLGLLGE